MRRFKQKLYHHDNNQIEDFKTRKIKNSPLSLENEKKNINIKITQIHFGKKGASYNNFLRNYNNLISLQAQNFKQKKNYVPSISIFAHSFFRLVNNFFFLA